MARVSQPFLPISMWFFFLLFFSFISSVEVAAQLVSGFLSEGIVLCMAVDCLCAWEEASSFYLNC